MFGFLKNRRRAELRAKPLRETERATVARAVHLWRHLSGEDRTKLEGDVQVFLDEKTFEGIRYFLYVTPPAAPR